MKARAFFLLLFAAILALRLCHIDILWAEEGLPLAAASQMLYGKSLYRDIWFDKPPLVSSLYLLWGTRDGWPLRLAGALYVLLACVLAYCFARELWTEREGRWAALLLAFFLSFDIPSAVMPLAADLLLLAPHLAAVYLAWRGQAFWSGVLAGVAFLVNSKALFVLAACALWSFGSLPLLAVGFVIPNAVAVLWLGSTGALDAWYKQVWLMGRMYAGSSFLGEPVRNGIIRTLHWAGFHASLLIGALWFWWRDRAPDRWRWAAWAAVSIIAVALGWRFFPRYFFQLLPVMTLAAARGAVLLRRKAVIVVLALLAPLIRFGPRYALLARDLATGQPHHWADIAMDQDSREAAQLVRAQAQPQDTLFVWGFRPELYIYTHLPAATRFLDCQPLTGVPADRHLTQSQPLFPDWARVNRQELLQSHPAFIADGLGPYNPKLAIVAFVDLKPWLAQYRQVARSQGTVIYGRQ